MLNLFWLILGLILLVGGADLLVRGVSSLARAAGVPPLVVGLTVVAFGTSLPELVINSLSAIHGQTDLAFGNIVGSSTINIGFVLAVTAIVRPLSVRRSIISREIPMLLLTGAVLLALSLDRFFNHSPENILVRGDGVVLLLVFCVFLYYVIKESFGSAERLLHEDPLVDQIEHNIQRSQGLGAAGTIAGTLPLWVSALMTLVGLVCVAGGGRLAVTGAVGIAQRLNVPQVIIGLTIVSFGTTLPELVTSITAARRGQSDIAIGNVVGSNIFNILFIGGLVATIRPVPVPIGGEIDLLVMFGLSVILLPIAIRGPRKITRAEGVFLLLAYFSYFIWLTASA